MSYPECLARYRWDEHRDKTPNDYRSKEDSRTQYPFPPMTDKEMADHFRERQEWEDLNNDVIPW